MRDIDARGEGWGWVRIRIRIRIGVRVRVTVGLGSGLRCAKRLVVLGFGVRVCGVRLTNIQDRLVGREAFAQQLRVLISQAVVAQLQTDAGELCVNVRTGVEDISKRTNIERFTPDLSAPGHTPRVTTLTTLPRL